MRMLAMDVLAVNGTSYLHGVHPYSKLMTAGLIMAALLLTTNSYMVISIGIILCCALKFQGKLSLLKQMCCYIYPLCFSFFYGKLLGFTGEQLTLVMGRAMVAVMILLVLISTTPYIKVFAVMSKLMPPVLADIFFLTYRAFFLLLGKMQETFIAIKLKGGMQLLPAGRQLVNLASCLGLTFVKAVELNERSYWSMVVRGYNGGIRSTGQRGIQLKDTPVLMTGLLFFVLAVWT